MEERFGDPVEKETDSDASRKEHHKVRKVVKFGLFVLLAELDVSIANGEPKDKKGKARIGDNCVEKGASKHSLRSNRGRRNIQSRIPAITIERTVKPSKLRHTTTFVVIELI